MIRTMSVAGLRLAALLVGGISTACASAVPLPTVDSRELLEVDREIGDATLLELDQQRDLRYWEIFLTDDEFRSSLSPEKQSELASKPLPQMASMARDFFK